MAKDRHLSEELLEQTLHGKDVSPGFVRLLIEHVIRDCRRCRKAYRGFATRYQRTDRYSEITLEVLGGLADHHIDVEALRREATEEFERLLRTPPEDRLTCIQRATTKYRSPLLVDLLIEESRRLAPRDPFASYGLAELGQAVALQIPHSRFGTSWSMTSLARANAYRGNALRAAGEIKNAEPLLSAAIGTFDKDGSGDPLVRAELFGLLASLRKDQRRLSEAERILASIISIYREAREEHLLARALLKQGSVWKEMGDLEAAIRTAREASTLVDQSQDSRLYLWAQHNIACYLVESERYREAQDLLVDNAGLYAAVPDRRMQLRRTWLDAVISRGLGDLEAAAHGLQAARRGFLGVHEGFDAALVGLDLALVYLERGEPAKVRLLAEEMVPVFQAQDINREAVAGLLLFQEAARQDAVTASMIKELERYLCQARRRPPKRRA